MTIDKISPPERTKRAESIHSTPIEQSTLSATSKTILKSNPAINKQVVQPVASAPNHVLLLKKHVIKVDDKDQENESLKQMVQPVAAAPNHSLLLKKHVMKVDDKDQENESLKQMVQPVAAAPNHVLLLKKHVIKVDDKDQENSCLSWIKKYSSFEGPDIYAAALDSVLVISAIEVN